MYVSQETLRRAVRLAGDLADLDDPEDFVGLVLPALAGLVGCDVITYNEIGPAPRQTRYADHPAGSLDPATSRVFAAYVHEHPLVSYYRSTGNGEPVKISDFLSRERFHRLALYAEFFRHVPTEHQLAISLPACGDQVVGIALNRARCDFTEDDRALLDILRSPLAAALLRVRALAPPAPPCDLTGRETQILRLVAGGHTDSAIARRLGVSPRTIAKHLEHVYRKLGVANRAAAVSRFSGR